MQSGQNALFHTATVRTRHDTQADPHLGRDASTFHVKHLNYSEIKVNLYCMNLLKQDFLHKLFYYFFSKHILLITTALYCCCP